VVTIPTRLRERIRGKTDVKGKTIVDLNEFDRIDKTSFTFNFIDPTHLTKQERMLYNQTERILSLVGGKPNRVKAILISENMRKDFLSYETTAGLWEPAEGRIIIHRNQLRSFEYFAGTLLHEVAHVNSNASDSSRRFETELSSYLGKLATIIIG